MRGRSATVFVVRGSTLHTQPHIDSQLPPILAVDAYLERDEGASGKRVSFEFADMEEPVRGAVDDVNKTVRGLVRRDDAVHPGAGDRPGQGRRRER